MSDSLLDMMKADAQDGSPIAVDGQDLTAPENKQLARLVEMGQQQLVLETRIAAGEALLETLKQSLHKLRTETLPQAMIECGTLSFKMFDGSEVKVEKMYFASIPSEEAIAKAKSEEEREKLSRRRVEAFAWLRKNGHASLIKNTVEVCFGRGEDKKAAALIKTCIVRKLDYSQQEAVHGATLKAFVREQIENGKKLPAETLGVSTLDISKIVPAKIKKQKKG